MKRITIGILALLAVGSIGVAQALPVNLVTNGDFSATSPGQTMPTQFGNSTGSCNIGSRTWGGQFVSGWTGATGYEIWYPSASAATGTQACTQYGNTGDQLLPPVVTAAPNGVATFVGLDGQENIRASLTQTVGGLVVGQKYKVNFWWASTQEMSRQGATTEQLQVSLGSETHGTSTAHNVGNDAATNTYAWTDWAQVSMTFTASATSEVLKFLSNGTPGNQPPFAVLSDVSMFKTVPEPPELAMFGGGLLLLGAFTVFARRRAQRRNGVGNLG